MKRKQHILERKSLKDETNFSIKKKDLKEKNLPKIRGRKLDGLKNKELIKKDDLMRKRLTFWNKLFTKKNITYFVLLVLDIFLIIYVARKNVVHLVDFNGKTIFIGDEKKLWLGRNYISLVVTSFFYLYTCVMHRYFLHEKNTKKFLIGLFFLLVILNELLFYLFTVRVY